MKKQQIKDLASSLYFEMDDNQILLIQKEFEQLYEKIYSYNNIETTNIIPTNFCHNLSSNNLRKDILSQNENNDDHFNNTTLNKERWVILK